MEMKRIILKVIFILLSIQIYTLDFNKDNFAFSLDEENVLVVDQKYIYYFNYFRKIEWKSDRPQMIRNQYGYASIFFPVSFPYKYYSNNTFFIIEKDDSGIFMFVKNENKGLLEKFEDMYWNLKLRSIKASSELVEKDNTGYTTYKAIYTLTKVNAEGSPGPKYYPGGLPWVPDISKDSNPFIDIEFQDSVKGLSILPGFIDFNRQHLYYQNSRPKTIEVIDLNSNVSLGKFVLSDEMKFQSFTFSFPVKKFRIRLIDYYSGTKYKDPCISALVFSTYFLNDTGTFGDYFLQDENIKSQLILQ